MVLAVKPDQYKTSTSLSLPVSQTTGFTSNRVSQSSSLLNTGHDAANIFTLLAGSEQN